MPTDDPDAIEAAVRELVSEVVRRNCLDATDILSVIFSATRDVTRAYPGATARACGWGDVPILCVAEMVVEGSVPRCIRILLHASVTGDRAPKHVYLREARCLRPDLVSA